MRCDSPDYAGSYVVDEADEDFEPACRTNFLNLLDFELDDLWAQKEESNL
jgi:hypothetical protein